MSGATRFLGLARVFAQRAVYNGGMQRSIHSTGAALKEFAHLPLGAVPADTDLNEVREKWGSNAMDLINETEVIEVDADFVVCDGGGGALGHPLEYIKLKVSDEGAAPQVCKYCGLRYIRKLK